MEYKMLKILLKVLIILFFTVIYFAYKNYFSNRSEEVVLTIMKKANISPNTTDFIDIKRQIEYLMLHNFTIYTSTVTISNKTPEGERWVILESNGISTLRLANRDEKIDIKNGEIIGAKMFRFKIPRRIKELDLSNSYLSSAVLIGFENLEKINFRSCFLTHLELSQLPSLRVVDISWNEHLKSVSFSDLINLEKIYIGWRIEEINLSNLPSMRIIDFSDTYSLRKIVVSDMPLVESINLKGCSISTATFQNLTTVKEVNLSKNKINDIKFVNLPKVLRLNIKETNVSQTLLNKIVSDLTHIEWMDVSWNLDITKIDLSKLKNLRYLNITGNMSLNEVILSKSVKGKVEIEGFSKEVNIVFK